MLRAFTPDSLTSDHAASNLCAFLRTIFVNDDSSAEWRVKPIAWRVLVVLTPSTRANSEDGSCRNGDLRFRFQPCRRIHSVSKNPRWSPTDC